MPRFVRWTMVMMGLTLTFPAFAAGTQEATALNRVLTGPHSCTAMVQDATRAMVVCKSAAQGPQSYQVSAGWVRRHFQPMPDVSGLYTSDSPVVAGQALAPAP